MIYNPSPSNRDLTTTHNKMLFIISGSYTLSLTCNKCGIIQRKFTHYDTRPIRRSCVLHRSPTTKGRPIRRNCILQRTNWSYFYTKEISRRGMKCATIINTHYNMQSYMKSVRNDIYDFSNTTRVRPRVY